MNAKKLKQILYLLTLLFLVGVITVGNLSSNSARIESRANLNTAKNLATATESAENAETNDKIAGEFATYNLGDCSARGMAVLEMKTGRVLAGKNMNAQLKMASTTKIVTALTVIENCKDLDEPFKIDDRCVGVEGTSIYLRKGEVLTARELLYGLMLRSGNDASVALALHCANSIGEFAEMMNATAKKCGAVNSHFVNPHGLDADGHYTTAYDLALITTKALQNETFKEIVSSKNARISGGETGTRYLVNKNRLLNSLDGCVGVKTGFTKGAGRCLVSAVERDGMTVVCVVLNCGPMFEESAQLLNSAFVHFQNVELLKSYNFVCNIPIIDGEKNRVRVYNPIGFSYPLTEEEASLVSVDYDLPNELKAPLKSETKVGTARVYYKDKLLFETDILTMEEIKSDKLIDKVKDIIDKFV